MPGTASKFASQKFQGGVSKAKPSLVSRTKGAKLCKSHLVYNWASQAMSQDVIDALKPKLSTIAVKNKLNPPADGIERKASELFEALLGKTDIKTALAQHVIDALKPTLSTCSQRVRSSDHCERSSDQIPDQLMLNAQGERNVLIVIFDKSKNAVYHCLISSRAWYPELRGQNYAKVIGLQLASQAMSQDVIDALKPTLSTIAVKNRLVQSAIFVNGVRNPPADGIERKASELFEALLGKTDIKTDTPITPSPDVAIVLKQLDKVLVAPDKLMLLFRRHSMDEFLRVVTGLFVQYQRFDCLKPRSTIAPVERVSLAPEAGATPAANSAWQRVRLHVPCGDILTIGQCQTPHSALSRFPFLLDDDGKSVPLNPPAMDIERKAREFREALLGKTDIKTSLVSRTKGAKLCKSHLVYNWASQAMSQDVIDALKPTLSTIAVKNKLVSHGAIFVNGVRNPPADGIERKASELFEALLGKTDIKTDTPITPSPDVAIVLKQLDKVLVAPDKLMLLFRRHSMDEFLRVVTGLFVQYQRFDCLKPRSTIAPVERVSLAPEAGATPAANSAWQRVRLHVPCGDILTIGQCQTPHSALSRFPFLLDDDGKSVPLNPPAMDIERKAREFREALLGKTDIKTDTPITPSPDVAIVLKQLDKVLVAPDKLMLLFRRHSMDEFLRVVTGLFVQYQRFDCLKPRSTIAPVERVSLAPEAGATPAANSAWQRVRLHVPCGDILTIGQCQTPHSALSRFPFLLDDDGKSVPLNPPAMDIERKAREFREALLGKTDIKTDTPITPSPDVAIVLKQLDKVLVAPDKLMLLFRRHSMDEFSRVVTGLFVQYQASLIATIAPVERVSLAPEAGATPAANSAWQRVRLHVPCGDILTIGQCQTPHSALSRFPFLLDDDGKSVPLNPPADGIERKASELFEALLGKTDIKTDTPITPSPDVAIVLKQLDKVLVAPDKLMLLFRRHSMDEFSRVVTGLFVQYQASLIATIAPVERVSLAPEAGATPAANSAWQRVRLHVPCGDILTIGQCQTPHSALSRFPFLLDDDGKSVPLNPPADGIERKASELFEALLGKTDIKTSLVSRTKGAKLCKSHLVYNWASQAMSQDVIDALKPTLSTIAVKNKLNPPADGIERKAREFREALLGKTDIKTDTPITPSPDVAIVLKQLDKVLVAPDKLMLLFRRHSMDEFSRVVTGLFVQYQASLIATIAPVERVSLAPEAGATPAANSAWQRVRLHVPCGDILTIGQCQTPHSALSRFPFLLDDDGKSVPLRTIIDSTYCSWGIDLNHNFAPFCLLLNEKEAEALID
uniref:Uncharacterized protein n=1 Tax=Globodera rostochiensis TaxID=31243 RepID=A0A914GSK0_GLORO